jgi:hypothetical protein
VKKKMGRLSQFFLRIRVWVASFPCSLFLGILIGIVFLLIIQKKGAFIEGIVIGLILRELLLGGKRVASDWISTHPLRKLLGSISKDEDCYIFLSFFYRDLNRQNEFKLARWNPEQHGKETLIKGPFSVLGDGDAMALSFIRSLLAYLPKKHNTIRVERAETHIDKWGISCFCIGAHNPRVQTILSKFENTFFCFDGNYTVITKRDAPSLVDSATGKNLRKGVFIEPNGSEPTDYGILLKLQDEFNKNGSTIFVVAGIGPAGTSGAAYYLLSKYKELSALGQQFGLLLQVPSGYQSAREVDFDKVANFYFP